MAKYTKAVLTVIACFALIGCQALSPGTGLKSLDSVSSVSGEQLAYVYRVDRAFVGSAATLNVSLNNQEVEMNEGDFWQFSLVEGINQIEVQYYGGVRDSLVFDNQKSSSRYFLVGSIGDGVKLIKELTIDEWKKAVEGND